MIHRIGLVRSLVLASTMLLLIAVGCASAVDGNGVDRTADAHERTGFELPPSRTPIPRIELEPGVIQRITYEDFERRAIGEHSATPYGLTTTDEAARLGNWAGVADLRDGDPEWRGGSPRAEWHGADTAELDVERWHAISYYLPPDWNRYSSASGGGGNRIVWQFHTSGGAWGPIYGIRLTDTVEGPEWRFYRKRETGSSEILWTESAMTETWVDFVIHVNWTTDATGYIEFYRNQEVVYSSQGVRTMHTSDVDIGPYSKWGVYLGTARILVDEIRMAEGPDMLTAVSP